MVRRILGVIAGVAVGMGVIIGMESASLALFPPPPGLDMKDPQAINDYVATLPISAFLIVLIAHALAALLGAMMTTLVAGRTSVRPGMIVGGVFMVGGIVLVLRISHPVWFSLLDVMAYLPAAFGGAWLTMKRSAAAPEHEPG